MAKVDGEAVVLRATQTTQLRIIFIIGRPEGIRN